MKQRKKILIAWTFCLVLLVGCSAPPTPNIDTRNQESLTPPTRALSNDLTYGYYRTIVPHVSSPTRGLVFSRLSNRFDIDELELSLMRASTSFFDPEELFLQDGQHLTRDFVVSLLRPQLSSTEVESELRENENFVDFGLNPPVNEERVIDSVSLNNLTYLAYLTEQNFGSLDEDGEIVLEGASIGLALNPYQILRNAETGATQTFRMNEGELIAEGERIAERLIEHLRTQEAFESIPIMIGLYVLEANTAVVPGRMVAKTLIEENSQNIRNWENVEERHFLLSDSRMAARASELDMNIVDEFNYFQNTIRRYYPNNYGIIGIAHFIDRTLHNLEITVNIEFLGLQEKLALHQIIGEVISEFSPNYNVTVVIRSSSEVFGTVQRPPNGSVSINRFNW